MLPLSDRGRMAQECASWLGKDVVGGLTPSPDGFSFFGQDEGAGFFVLA